MEDKFDPRKYGATPAGEDTFDPSAHGATLISDPEKSTLPPQKLSLMDQIYTGLKRREGEGTAMGSLKGVGRGILNLASPIWEIPKALMEGPVPEDVALSGLPGGAAQPLVRRFLVDPAMESGAKAVESWKQGHPIRAAIHGAAAVAPLAGPALDTLIETGESGDIAGAITEGLTSFGLPFALKVPMAAVRRGLRSGPGLKMLGATEERMGKAPTGGPAASMGTRADVAKFGAEKGIELLPGQATESRPLRAIQAVGERSLAGEPLQAHLEGQRATLSQAVEGFKNRMAPPDKFPGREDVGGYYKEQTNLKMEMLKKAAEDDFQEWTKETGNMPIDTTPLQQKWGSRLKEMDTALANTPASYARPIRDIMEKASKFGKEVMAAEIPETVQWGGETLKLSDLGPAAREIVLKQIPPKLVKTIRPRVSVSDAGQMRSAFWEIAHNYAGNIPERVNAIASEIVKDIDGQMAQAAKEAGTLDLWRGANAKWKMLQEMYNTGSSPLYKILKEADPSKVPAKLSSKGDIGGSPRSLQIAKAAGLDLDPLKRQVIQEIAEKNFGLAGRGGHQLGGYSHEFLSELFTPDQLNELYMHGRLARAIKWEMNPSGTSDVMSALEEIGAVPRLALRTLFRGPAAVKFTLNPRVREAVTRISPQKSLPSGSPPKLPIPRKSAPGAAIGIEQQNRILREINRK